MLAVLTACAGDDDQAVGERPGAEQVVDGQLHDCAAGWPVPDGIAVLDTALGRDQGGEPTCVVSLETEQPVAEAVASYHGALDAAGWAYEVRQADETAGMIELTGPRCGVLLVLPEGELTAVLVSLLDCERVRERPPSHPPEGR